MLGYFLQRTHFIWNDCSWHGYSIFSTTALWGNSFQIRFHISNLELFFLNTSSKHADEHTSHMNSHSVRLS